MASGTLHDDPVQVFAAKSVGFDKGLPSPSQTQGFDGKFGSPTLQGALVAPGAGTRPKHAAPTKHASMISIGKGNAPLPFVGHSPSGYGSGSSSVSPKETKEPQVTFGANTIHQAPPLPQHQPQQQLQQQQQQQPSKKSVSRSISTYFKSLFTSKNSSEAGEPGQGGSMPMSPTSKNNQSFTLKAVPDTLPTSPGSKSFAYPSNQTAHSVQSSAKSSTAAIESEVAAAMRRAASITGRQHAPSTLLSVSSDLPPKMHRPVWNLRDYAVVEKMYTGYASNVYKAFCKFSGETVCLKSYALGNLCELNRFQIFREVKLHSSLSHEHIIKLYGAFQQADQVVLVQEYAEAGDLFNLLQRYGGRLPERTAVELCLYPFLCVINYLHSNGIAHRDIKPENILFTGDMRLKLCDFGLAINMREERAVTRAGTLEYMAPEVLNCPFKNKPEENKENHDLHYSFHVDTWAAGVLTYELLVGIPPFSDKQRDMVEDKIRLEMPRFPNKMSELAKDFITRALEKDPLERPTIMDMVGHRWIRTLRRSASVRQLISPSSTAAPSSNAGKLAAVGPNSSGPVMTNIHEGEDEDMHSLAAPSSKGNSMVCSPNSSQMSPVGMTLPGAAQNAVKLAAAAGRSFTSASKGVY